MEDDLKKRAIAEIVREIESNAFRKESGEEQQLQRANVNSMFLARMLSSINTANLRRKLQMEESSSRMLRELKQNYGNFSCYTRTCKSDPCTCNCCPKFGRNSQNPVERDAVHEVQMVEINNEVCPAGDRDLQDHLRDLFNVETKNADIPVPCNKGHERVLPVPAVDVAERDLQQHLRDTPSPRIIEISDAPSAEEQNKRAKRLREKIRMFPKKAERPKTRGRPAKKRKTVVIEFESSSSDSDGEEENNAASAQRIIEIDLTTEKVLAEIDLTDAD